MQHHVHGNNYPFDEIANGTVVVDNKNEVIKELQSTLNKVYNSGLAVDGIIGVKTNAVLKKVALKNYCANELVTFVQKRLVEKGYNIGNCGVDGKYGKDTETAVRKYQSDIKISVDGITGINTITNLVK